MEDIYRDIMCQGGIPFTGFHDSIAGKMTLDQALFPVEAIMISHRHPLQL